MKLSENDACLLHKALLTIPDSRMPGGIRHHRPAGIPIAVDGKTLKGARSPDGRQMHLLAAFLHQEATVAAQAQAPSTTNGTKTVKQLPDPLPMQGTVATPDALHTQQETARYPVEGKKQTASSRSKITGQPSRHTSKISIPPTLHLTIRPRTKGTDA